MHYSTDISLSHPTSLSREASRCRDRSDMRKWRVVSAEGWGPGFSGANCTFRITRRTEFLGAGGVSPQAPNTHSYLPQGLGLLGVGREWANHQGGGFPHLLWLFSSTDLAQKARISKSTPQALGGGRKVTSYTRPLPPAPLFSSFPGLGQGLLPHPGLRSTKPGPASPRLGIWQRLCLGCTR